ncbi:MAG: hypothetical protein LBP76_11115 [Treponema sp.]|jgi:hypothetical protein|nr:hypothetical protein [Treponema sp.]
MKVHVYISNLKDNEFDYTIENPNGDSQYAPKPISPSVRIYELYDDIVHQVLHHNENTKQTDWGTFVIKLTNTDLINFLSKEEYKRGNRIFEEIYHKKTPAFIDGNTLLDSAKKLEDGEYLLVAQELS